MNNIGIVILAAGASSRLGKPKQNLLFRGKTLLNHAIAVAKQTNCGPVVVITGAYIPDADYQKDSSIYFVHNADWENGIASSISLGVNYFEKIDFNIKGIILMVCDQPYVTARLLIQMISDQYNTNKPIIACSYQDTLGTPVLFEKVYFEILTNLKGDEGAKRIIYENLESIKAIAFDKGHIDIDRQSEYDDLIATEEKP